jgi:TRAP-type C4-dicarboxylate transport system permease small subunit
MDMPETIVRTDGGGTAQPTTFGYRTTDHPGLDKVQNAISGLCAWIAGIATVLLTILTLVSVISREFFSDPMAWNVSATEKYLLPAIAFFGMVTAYRTSTHIAVTSIFDKFGPQAQKVMLVVIHVIVLLVLVALFAGGATMALDAYNFGFHVLPGSADLATADWTWRIIVPVSALFGTVVVAIDLYREIATPWDRPYTNYEPGSVLDEENS